jgi:hypothetical protein
MGAALLGALVTLSPSALSGAGTQIPTNAPAPVKTSTPNVSVFFGEHKALSIEEIRLAAKELLKRKGHQIEDSFHCAINIGVLGKDAGCSVIFQDLPRRMLYTVEFNAKGDPAVRYAGPERHRTPRFGEGGSLPEGRKVPVKP